MVVRDSIGESTTPGSHPTEIITLSIRILAVLLHHLADDRLGDISRDLFTLGYSFAVALGLTHAAATATEVTTGHLISLGSSKFLLRGSASGGNEGMLMLRRRPSLPDSMHGL